VVVKIERLFQLVATYTKRSLRHLQISGLPWLELDFLLEFFDVSFVEKEYLSLRTDVLLASHYAWLTNADMVP